MIKQALLPILAVMALSVPAMAQDSGGVPLAPGIHGGPKGLARPLPFVRQPFQTAQSVQNGMTAADHQAADQNAITQLRGDPGFLSGFLQGQPLAASRQPPVPNDGGWYWHHHHHQGQSQALGGGQGPRPSLAEGKAKFLAEDKAKSLAEAEAVTKERPSSTILGRLQSPSATTTWFSNNPRPGRGRPPSSRSRPCRAPDRVTVERSIWCRVPVISSNARPAETDRRRSALPNAGLRGRIVSCLQRPRGGESMVEILVLGISHYQPLTGVGHASKSAIF